MEIELPNEWKLLTIADIGKVKGGKRLPKGETYSEAKTKFPYLRVTDFDRLTIKQNNLKYLSPGTQSQIKNYTISSSDVFISIAGTIGQVGVIPNNLDGANLTENAAKITDLKDVYNLYLAYFLSSQTAQAQIKGHTIATTQPKLSLFRIEKITIPCPPLTQQHHIVEKIEELFSELDKGIENLKTAQQQLKVYRQAVLKWAFEGNHVKTNVGELFNFVGGGTPSKKEPTFWNGNIPWASVKDVKGDYLEKTQDTISGEGLKNSASNVANPSDVILITRISPGKVIITNIKTAVNQDLKIVKPKFKTSTKYIYYLFKSIERECINLSSGTTVLGINLTNLKEITVPKIDLEDQQKIVQEIESRLSVCDKMEETINDSLQQAEALRQSILKRAFEGKLVNERHN